MSSTFVKRRPVFKVIFGNDKKKQIARSHVVGEYGTSCPGVLYYYFFRRRFALISEHASIIKRVPFFSSENDSGKRETLATVVCRTNCVALRIITVILNARNKKTKSRYGSNTTAVVGKNHRIACIYTTTPNVGIKFAFKINRSVVRFVPFPHTSPVPATRGQIRNMFRKRFRHVSISDIIVNGYNYSPWPSKDLRSRIDFPEPISNVFAR